ncbi:MAG: VCBS repeat-containing protein [Phycisphaerales bacterium]
MRPNLSTIPTRQAPWSACAIAASVCLLFGCPSAEPSAEAASDEQTQATDPLPQPTLTVIPLDITRPPDTDESAGGLLVADLDDDGRMDYLVTVPGRIAAYSGAGEKLWIKDVDLVVGGSSEAHGLPGHHGPGVAAGDVDSDEGLRSHLPHSRRHAACRQRRIRCLEASAMPPCRGCPALGGLP